jgi:hypothetical protein
MNSYVTLGLILGLLFAGSVSLDYALYVDNGYRSLNIPLQTQSAESSMPSLILHLELNTTVLKQGQAISIVLTETNNAPEFNNITAADNWAYRGFQPGLCTQRIGISNLPFNIAIIKGYYSELSLYGNSLPIFYPPNVVVDCITGGGVPTEYDFYPNSDNAVVNSSFNNGLNSIYFGQNETISTSISFDGYYNSTSTSFSSDIIPFAPGTYTVIGGDEWGKLVMLHFVVE